MSRHTLTATRAIGTTLAAVVAAGLLAAPAVAQTGKPAKDPRTTALQEVIEDQVERAGIPGVLASVRDGKRVWRGEAGVADLRTGKKRGDHDRFRIGSITKTFVTTVILKLEAEGRLDLDDTVEKWLPGLVTGNGHDGSKVTIRQLLNHTSGISNYTANPEFGATYLGEEGFLKNRYHRHSPESLVGWAMRSAPDFEPGAGWNYSNTNFILAGLIIEKATGRSYEQEMQDRILRPLGLRNTTLPRHSAAMPKPSGRAYSKMFNAGPDAKFHDATRLNASWGWSAGDMISTTGDLQRFAGALLSGKLLPPAQQKELTTAVTLPVPGADVGYGLGLERAVLSCGVEIWGHSGGIHGSISEMYTTSDGKRTMVTNANGDWNPDRTPATLNAAFCGEKPSQPAPSLRSVQPSPFGSSELVARLNTYSARS
ncbi:serine hydrolase domain-containing protein [Streptomyces sp. CAU 1734]|uniref:serine hydrolase domain-containing protein n=1 Tax=Streptomyces sp. CAU 1734 TaxID=3140360 RepID=UPI0032609C74